MFSRTRSSHAAAPSFHVSPRTLRMLNLARRLDDMLMFYVVTVAIFASIAVLPAYAAIAPAHQGKEAATKSDRLPSGEVESACAGQSWGRETGECLVAIFRDSGREPGNIRIVVAAADPGRSS